MFERHSQPLISTKAYIRRQFFHFILAALIIAGSLLLGIAGYRWLEGLPWIDALLNASMILGGMGPVNGLQTPAGKLFASFYALYSGLVFLVTAGVIFAPLFHRFLHRFHLEDEAGDSDSAGKRNRS
jgi:hypothetical protein